jgi:hypothetical protein
VGRAFAKQAARNRQTLLWMRFQLALDLAGEHLFAESSNGAQEPSVRVGAPLSAA